MAGDDGASSSPDAGAPSGTPSDCSTLSLPPNIASLLYDDYAALDPDAPKLLEAIRRSAATEIWHKHGSFRHHLIGVWRILHCWACPQKVCRLGLFHSAYSNSFVAMGLFNPDTEREALQELVGPEAEELIYQYCVINRQDFEEKIMEKGAIPSEGLTMPHIRNPAETVWLCPETCYIFLIHTVADYCEQFLQWQETMMRGHVQALWPGSGRPQTMLAFGARLAKAAVDSAKEFSFWTDPAKGYAAPPVFENCSRLLTQKNERGAAEAYARAYRLDFEMGGDNFGERDRPVPAEKSEVSAAVQADPDRNEILSQLEEACDLNPFVGEPFVLRAQIHVSRGQWQRAQELAERGVRLLWGWGTNWDKRVAWEGWIAWGRCIYFQAGRREWPTTSGGIQSLGAVNAVHRYREKLNVDGWKASQY